MQRRLGRCPAPRDLQPFYAEWTARGYNRAGLGWLAWAETGRVPQRVTPQTRAAAVAASLESLRHG
jgi:hypothetical protein